MMTALANFKRPRFQALPAPDSLGSDDDISSLPDLIRFNAARNPDHTFCYQARSQSTRGDDSGTAMGPFSLDKITFGELQMAVDTCIGWIKKNVSSEELIETASVAASPKRPIALYLESDVGLFIYLAALMQLGISVLLLSIRLSSEGIQHLMKETHAKTLFASARTLPNINDAIRGSVQAVMVTPYTALLEESARCQHITPCQPDGQHAGLPFRERGALVLHSSGTTGMPKPVSTSSRYPLRYASCHNFAASTVIDWCSVTTLPLYHGFGLLAPCLSLSIGMTCVLPPSAIIPAPQSVLNLIRASGAASLMTVPSIVEEMLTLPEAEHQQAISVLAGLNFVAVGGGALRMEHCRFLAENGVSLLNHYGVSEIGPIAPIFTPEADYDWRYLRLRDDLNLKLKQAENGIHWKLVGPSANEDGWFEVQDELERREDPLTDQAEVRILGRKDDVIVLKTGEKVRPNQLEDVLSSRLRAIKSVVVVGTGHFEVALIIQPSDPVGNTEDLRNEVWRQVQDINGSLDAHARVSSKYAIIVVDSGKSIPRSDKGSVLRARAHEVFKAEIEQAYIDIEQEATEEDFDLSALCKEPLQILQALIAATGEDRPQLQSIGIEDDLFESGMDSLQATRLARRLNAILSSVVHERVSNGFIYRHPSIQALANAVLDVIHGKGADGGIPTAKSRDRITVMETAADRMIQKLTQALATKGRDSHKRGHVILMTGSTGNLGAHALASLARLDDVAEIICFCRQGEVDARRRQEDALHQADRYLASEHWCKIRILGDLEQWQKADYDPNGSPVLEFFDYLAANVTHIMHLAWPMDFGRSIESFQPHLTLLRNLIHLCRQANECKRSSHSQVRLVFASSIAVVRYPDTNADGTMVPEKATVGPRSAAPMGYAEAKWVCEKALESYCEGLQSDSHVVTVRIGQLSGPVRGNGVWKHGEHVPALLKASQKVGCLPALSGTVSWLPVDAAAESLVELMLHKELLPRFVHLENPVRQSIRDIFVTWAPRISVHLDNSVPFSQWLEKCRRADALGSLSEFFQDHFEHLALGGVILDTTNARLVSGTLRHTGLVEEATLVAYVERWRSEGFLN